MFRLARFLPVALLVISILACNATTQIPSTQIELAASPSQSQNTATAQLPPTDTPAPQLTDTPAPSPTPTVAPSPTSPPSLAIDTQTLGQMRLLWSISAPGAGNPITNVQCMSTSCDMLTRIGAYTFNPDNSLLAVGVCKGGPTEDRSGGNGKRFGCPGGGEVQLYRTVAGNTHDTLAINGFPRALAFDPSGKTLAVGTSDGNIELWDLSPKQQLRTLQHPTKSFGVISLAFSPDGTLLFSQGDGKIVAWDPAKGTNLKTMTGYGRMSFDPSGQNLVASWYDGNTAAVIVRIINLAHFGQKDIRPKFVQPNMFNEDIRSAFSPDGQRLVIIGANGAEWWDAQGTKMEGHTDVNKLIQSKKEDAFSAVGAFLPNGLVLTEPGLGISMPGMPIPSFSLGGTFTCGFALWDPTMPGAYDIANPPSGCQAPTAMGDSQRAVVSHDGSRVAADDGGGNLRVWGVDATATPVQPTCLGTCQH
jgi:WD40 repeat protein